MAMLDEKLIEAAGGERLGEVRRLLREGANVNAKTDYESTPLHYASFGGRADVVEILISNGADVNAKDNRGSTPLHSASWKGHADVVEILISKGADIRPINSFGRTPFLAAAANDHDRVARLLVLHGALCADNNSDIIEGDRIYSQDPRVPPEGWKNETTCRRDIFCSCERLVEWAGETLRGHSSMIMFLLGTLEPAPGTDNHCILHCLAGQPGIRKNITDFVGLEVTKRRHLRILRQVRDVLPAFIIE